MTDEVFVGFIAIVTLLLIYTLIILDRIQDVIRRLDEPRK